MLVRPVTLEVVGASTIDVSDEQARNLRRWNVAMAVLHAASALTMFVLATDFTLPITNYVADHPPGAPLVGDNLIVIGNYPLALGTALFALLSALFHAIAAGPAFGWYRNEITHGRNRLRWIEYALSSTLMILLIGGLNIITDVAALVAIAGANVSMILFGWLMEVANPPGRRSTWWPPFVFGSVAGAFPWLAIAASLFTGGAAANVPGFVWGIIISLFVFFNCFAFVQLFEYRGKGRLADPVKAEKSYQVLSLTAKTALAWQIFAGALMG